MVYTVSLGGDFRKLWAGNASANLGDGIAFVAIPLLATSLTSDPRIIGGLALVYSAVRLVVVIPVGVYVDRLDRRSILWAANLGRGLLLAGLAWAFATDAGSLVLLYVSFGLIGLLETAADNAGLSILPSVVPRDRLDRANGQISAAQLIADEFAGPPLGGFLFAVAVSLPLAATAGLYAAAALFFLSLPRPLAAGEDGTIGLARKSVFREAAAGGAWLRRHRLLGGLALVSALASVAYMMPFSILVLYGQEVLGLGATGYGWLLAASAVGGLIGTFATVPLRVRIGYGRVIAASLAIGSLALTALAFTTVPWVAALLLAAYIFHAVVWGISASAIRQQLVPAGLRGRVNAFAKLLGLLGLALGAAIGGPLASSYGLSAPFLAGGLMFLVCVGVVMRLFIGRPAELA